MMDHKYVYPHHPWNEPKYSLLSGPSKSISMELADDCEKLGREVLEAYPEKKGEWDRRSDWGSSLMYLADKSIGFRGNCEFPELTDVLEDMVNWLECIIDDMYDDDAMDPFADDMAEVREDIEEARHCIAFDRSRYYYDTDTEGA